MSYLKIIVATVWLCLITGAAVATSLQNYTTTQTVTGIVKAADSDEPVAGAHVRANGNVTVTDSDGVFQITVDSQADQVTIRISYVGFRPLSETVRTASPENQQPLQFYLTPASEMMSPLTVLSHRAVNGPSDRMGTEKALFLPIDSGEFLRDAGNTSGIRKGGFGIDPVLRGLSGSRLNIRLDGLATTAAACPNRMDPPTSHIRLSDIERVEIHHGPHALQYGPAFGGTVNFISRRPAEYNNFEMSGDLRTGLESNTGHRKLDTHVQGGNRAWDFLLNGGISATDNYTGGNGVEVDSGFESYDYGIETGFNITPGHRLTAGWSQSFIRDADFPALGMDMAVDDTYKLKAGYEWSPVERGSISSAEINGYRSLVDHEMNNHNRASFEMRDAVALAETETFGLHGTLKGLYSSGSYTFTAGIDQHDVTGTRFVEFKTGQRAGDSMTYNLWQDASILNAGIYSGIEHYSGEWTFSVGTRLDLNHADSNDPAPRFKNTDVRSEHLNFSISSGITRQFTQSTTLGLYLGRGVRSPDVTERYINFLTIGRDGYEYAGNPDLDAEINNQVDLVFKSEQGALSLESTLFAAYMTNYISAVINPEMAPVGMNIPGVREFQNRGDALFTGFELGMNIDLTQSWYIGLNGSYTWAEYTDTNTPVAEIPPFETSVNIGGSLPGNLILPELNVRRAFAQTRYDEDFGESHTPGFWLVDASVSSSIYRGVNVSAGVRNLFDEDYYEHLNRQFNPGVNPTGDYLPEPGRRVFAELSIRF